MDSFEERCRKFNQYLDNLSEEEIKKENDKKMKKDKKDFQNLKKALLTGMCYYCGNPLSHFSEKKPCFHWLLKPKGFKKRHLPILYKSKSFHEMNYYLRWVANCEAPMRNISDLVEEKSSSKFIEETIRYQNLEWSFSCSYGDLKGHQNKQNGQMPHYHFQMKVDGKVMINFNGFHPPFHDYDEYCFAMKAGKFPRASYQPFQGAGMQHLFDVIEPERMLDLMSSAGNEEGKAQFKLDTIVEAEAGSTISGDEIAKIIEESKRKGVPIAKLIKRMKNVKVTTIVSPGPDIPEISKRNKR